MTEKRFISPCPMNMISFLQFKGLLNRNILFSERMRLEKEFLEWCEKGYEKNE